MPTKLKHSRGDVYLGNQANLEPGQIFLSYVNEDATASGGHTYSEGQFWIKDPSSKDLKEIANARSLDALRFRGYITKSFNGDFLNANNTTQIAFSHCHVGDFWVFKVTDKEHYNVPFYTDDILLVTKTEYENVENSAFRDKLKSIEYTRIPHHNVDFLADLADVDLNALNGISLRLYYNGEFKSLEEFYNLKKQNGFMYVATQGMYISKDLFEESPKRFTDASYIKIKAGDLIWYNGKKWVIIPSGGEAEDVAYTPNIEEIDAVITFEDWQKDLLKSSKNVKEALDVLNTLTAKLGKDGKIPYAQLPDALRFSLSVQGKFYPILDKRQDPNSESNQDVWPSPEDGSEMLSGYFWIVDCVGKKNVQYVDKTIPGRIVELNTGDFVVWVEATNKFEVIDNSDRISSIEVWDDNQKKFVSCTGSVQVVGKNGIRLQPTSEGFEISNDRKTITQDPEEDGIEGYFPIYTDGENELTNSELHQTLKEIISNINFQIGHATDSRLLDVFGNLGIHKTPGDAGTTFINNFLYLDSAALLKSDNSVFQRYTNIKPSERANFAIGDETLDIILPEASSLLIGLLSNDSLTPNYLTKTDSEGFITDTLISEILDSSEEFKENSEDGFINVGIGRTVTEDTDLGEITFFGKTKDVLPNSAVGFYTNPHSIKNADSISSNKTEHFLNRAATAKTHLVINPAILEDEIETFVKMPFVSGVLLTWEELELAFGSNGTPLMIPAWEEMNFRRGKFIGLDTSPITMRVNRPAHDNVSVTRENDLNEDYGTGKDSAWTYKDSSKEGSLQDEARTSKDDIVTFDSWLEAQRSIATKEAFIIPSTSTLDGESTLSKEMQLAEDANELPAKDLYGRDKSGGKYQRILPSRTMYKDEPVYYDPITGKLIPQNVTSKDVEMPAVGGVILTSRSRIEGGLWENT